MTDACVFCRIVAGIAEASVVYEDATTVAFLDIRQFHPGHALVVPRRHIPDIFELDDALAGELARTVVRVARAVHSAFRPDGMNVSQSNGAAGGQEVFHLHFHVLPRHQSDGLMRVYPSSPSHPPRSELDAQAQAIRAHLSRA